MNKIFIKIEISWGIYIEWLWSQELVMCLLINLHFYSLEPYQNFLRQRLRK